MKPPKHDPITRAAELARRLRALRDQGPEGLLDHLTPPLGLRRLLVLERRGDATHPSLVTPPLIELRELPPDVAWLPALAAIEPALRPAADAEVARLQRYREQHARGDRLFVAERGGQPLALCWAAATRAPVDYLHAELELAAGERYLYDAITRRDARGQRLMPSLYAFAATSLVRDGATRCVTLVRPSNRPMLRAMHHAGFQRAGVLTCLQIGERAWHLGATARNVLPLP